MGVPLAELKGVQASFSSGSDYLLLELHIHQDSTATEK